MPACTIEFRQFSFADNFIILWIPMAQVIDVSIILACYNEEEHLLSSVDELQRVAKSFRFSYELIFVEDRSRDRTKAMLEEFQSSGFAAKYIYHEHNKGRGAAVKSGFEAAKGRFIGFIDVDLEISPWYIEKAINQLDQHDVVVGNRSYFSRFNVNSVMRNATSRAYKRVSKFLLGHSYFDTEAGFKFFHRDKVAPFFNDIVDNHWFWDTEFMLNCQKHKLKVLEMPVEFVRNNRKKSTVKVLRDSRKYISAIFRYRSRQ